MKKGVLAIISAPAGCGKGTVIEHILNSGEGFGYSVSATTRSPRPGEIDGKNYYFLTREQFESNIKEDKMLEYACYCDNYYGTPKQAVLDRLAKGENVILESEVQGALQVKAKMPEAVMIFILPPSFEVLRQRLIGRGTEDMATVEKRLLQAKTELSYAEKYDYTVVNETDKSKECAENIMNIIKAQQSK